MYIKQINKVLAAGPVKVKKIRSIPEESQSETDEDEEYLEKMFVTSNFGTTKNDESHAADLMQRYK